MRKMKYIGIPDIWYKDFVKLKKLWEKDSDIKVSNTTLLCILLQQSVNWELVNEKYKVIKK